MSDTERALYGLAYTVGFFMGDGCLTSYPFKSSRNGRTYHKNDVSFGKPDQECIERVRDEIEAIFGKRYAIVRRKLQSGLPYYELTAHRREIFEFFSVNTRMKAELPQQYHRAPLAVRNEVLRGLFDSDGHVTESERNGHMRWEIGFSNTNLGLVKATAALLQRSGVKVGKVTEMEKAGYRTCYGIRPNMRSFADAGLFFYSRRRQERLERYLAHMLGSETMHTGAVTPA